MIKEVQINPVSRKMTHIDFVRVVMDEVVRVVVPVHLKGTSIGVKTSGGIVDFQVRELHVECLPNAIPDSFDIDISSLDIHHFLRISDLPIPEGVKVLDDPDRVVVTIALARAEETPEVAAAAETAEPEVIKKGKVEGAEE
jgi:large subunit ribosomal protein L25